MNEARLCVWRRGVAATQRGARQKRERGGERAGERGRKRAAPRGSIYHTSGGVIRTWEEGFEVWTSKRPCTHTHFQKYVGLKQMRSLRCPRKVQNKTKGRKRTSSSTTTTTTKTTTTAATKTLEKEQQRRGDNTAAVLVMSLLVLRLVRMCFAAGTARLSEEPQAVSSRARARRAWLCHISLICNEMSLKTLRRL